MINVCGIIIYYDYFGFVDIDYWCVFIVLFIELLLLFDYDCDDHFIHYFIILFYIIVW